MQKESIPRKTREFRQLVSRTNSIMFALHAQQAQSVKCEGFWINEETLEYNIVISLDEADYSLVTSVENAVFAQTWWRVIGTYDRVPPHSEVLAVTHTEDNVVYILIGDRE